MLTVGAPDEAGAVLTGAGRPVLGRLDVAALGEVARRVAALRPAAGLLRREPTRVAPLVAELHSAWLGAPEMREIALALARLSGAAEPDRPVLAFDVRSAALADVPWELLDDRFHVVRYAPGAAGPPRSPASALEVVTWVPDPTEEACRATLAVAARMDGLSLLPLDEAVRPPAPSPGVVRVLLVIAHGRAGHERVLMELGASGSAEGDAVGRWLRPVAETCALVVLCTCHGGRLSDGPALRLAASGVPVLAPRWTLGVDAASGLVAGLLGPLARGASLRAAVAEARRRILGLNRPVPDAWWWNLALYAEPERVAADAPLVLLSPLPSGWPIGVPEAQAVVDAAVSSARGWLGVEALARALEREAGLGAVSNRLAPYALDLPARGSVLTLTPAALRIGRRLAPGFGLSALYDAVVAELPFDLAELPHPAAPGPTGTTRTAGAHASLDPFPAGALVMEVLTGPEGGRRITMAIAETLGREAEPARATHRLYPGADLVDPKLSRCHLRCDPDGGITNMATSATVVVLRAQGARRVIPPGGADRVERADAVRVGNTWLLVVGVELPQSAPSQS